MVACLVDRDEQRFDPTKHLLRREEKRKDRRRKGKDSFLALRANRAFLLTRAFVHVSISRSCSVWILSFTSPRTVRTSLPIRIEGWGRRLKEIERERDRERGFLIDPSFRWEIKRKDVPFDPWFQPPFRNHEGSLFFRGKKEGMRCGLAFRELHASERTIKSRFRCFGSIEEGRMDLRPPTKTHASIVVRRYHPPSIPIRIDPTPRFLPMKNGESYETQRRPRAIQLLKKGPSFLPDVSSLPLARILETESRFDGWWTSRIHSSLTISLELVDRSLKERHPSIERVKKKKEKVFFFDRSERDAFPPFSFLDG